jgi:hypothetical protein
MSCNNLNIIMKFDDICNSILERVFHGTPHDVGVKFDISKIGTGEGAQAYGWGLYFAESPKVAEDYRKNLSKKNPNAITRFLYDGEELQPIAKSWEQQDPKNLAIRALSNVVAGLSEDGKVEMAIKAVRRFFPDAPLEFEDAVAEEARKLKPNAVENEKGNLYTVDIDADVENDFLDWDKPFSEQSIKIQNKLKQINLEDIYEVGRQAGQIGYQIYSKKSGYLDAGKPSFRTEEEAINFLKNPNGETLYSEINHDPKQASLSLLKMTIKGIKYLDQGSREKGEGTYNYVIFDPKIIKIVAKNGEFVMKGKTPENVEI